MELYGKGVFIWNKTYLGQTIHVPCPYGSLNTSADIRAYGHRRCILVSANATWEESRDLSACQYAPKHKAIIELCSEPVANGQVTERLYKITWLIYEYEFRLLICRLSHSFY